MCREGREGGRGGAVELGRAWEGREEDGHGDDGDALGLLARDGGPADAGDAVAGRGGAARVRGVGPG